MVVQRRRRIGRIVLQRQHDLRAVIRQQENDPVDQAARLHVFLIHANQLLITRFQAGQSGKSQYGHHAQQQQHGAADEHAQRQMAPTCCWQRPFLPGSCVQPLCFGALGRRQRGTHRLVTGNLPLPLQGHDERFNPVKVAVLAAVLDRTAPRISCLYGRPHIAERRFRHIWVADDVLILADQLVAGKSANFHKGIIDVGDDAFEVGARNNISIFGKRNFVTRNRLIIFHCVTRFFNIVT